VSNQNSVSRGIGNAFGKEIIFCNKERYTTVTMNSSKHHAQVAGSL